MKKKYPHLNLAYVPFVHNLHLHHVQPVADKELLVLHYLDSASVFKIVNTRHNFSLKKNKIYTHLGLYMSKNRSRMIRKLRLINI